jgi:DNA polymerase-3 subunit gamma/tau
MKISTLGQKKNNELTAPIEAKYDLPNLDAPKPQPTAVAPQIVATPQVVVEPKIEQSTVAPAPTPQPIAEQVATVQPEPKVEPTPIITPIVESKPIAEAKPKTSVILGGSIASLLDKVSNPVDGEGKSTSIVIDPESEAKMAQARESIIKQMCSERPRYVSAFESINFEGNVVKLAVPSEALKDELLGERFYILKDIAAIAGVTGSLDMKIEIKEIDFKLKPIKLEDRVAHIRKVMPEFDYMQKALDIDVE